MKKKFICTVCGYIYEGTEAPEKCPICKAPASKFKEMEDAADEDLTFPTVHVLGPGLQGWRQRGCHQWFEGPLQR